MYLALHRKGRGALELHLVSTGNPAALVSAVGSHVRDIESPYQLAVHDMYQLSVSVGIRKPS